MDDHLKNDLILFGEDETTVPQFKRYLENVTQSTMRSVITDITGAQGTKELAEIFGEKKFPYPKPTKLISRLIDLTTNPGDSILDPFSGSGSTGHAVLKMNAENPTETPRRFVLIEMEEEIEKDVTSVRLDRVIKGYETKKGKKVAGLSGHYSRWKIGEPLLTARGSLNKEVSELAIAQILAGENNLPLVEDKTFPNNVIAEDDSKVVFYYSSEHGALDDDDIENVDAIRKGRQAVVYTINSYVDEERVGDEVRVLILPYDFPVLQ
jgi:hypothetical protein